MPSSLKSGTLLKLPKVEWRFEAPPPAGAPRLLCVGILQQQPAPQHAPHSCPPCQLSFSSTKRLHRHLLRAHMVTDACKCLDCGRQFQSEKTLHRHILNRICVTKKQHICQYCLAPFPCQSKLILHVSTVHLHQAKSILCESCGAVFSRRGALQRHLLTFHGSSGAPTRRCPLCSSSFRATDNLQRHLVSRHANWKRWICSLCGNKYNHGVDLKRHLDKSHGLTNLPALTGRNKKDILGVHVLPVPLGGDAAAPPLDAEETHRLQQLRRLLSMVPSEQYEEDVIAYFRGLPLARPGIKQSQPPPESAAPETAESDALSGRTGGDAVVMVRLEARSGMGGSLPGATEDEVRRNAVVSQPQRRSATVAPLPQGPEQILMLSMCSTCGLAFTSQEDLNQHVLQVHSVPSVTASENRTESETVANVADAGTSAATVFFADDGDEENVDGDLVEASTLNIPDHELHNSHETRDSCAPELDSSQVAENCPPCPEASVDHQETQSGAEPGDSQVEQALECRLPAPTAVGTEHPPDGLQELRSPKLSEENQPQLDEETVVMECSPGEASEEPQQQPTLAASEELHHQQSSAAGERQHQLLAKEASGRFHTESLQTIHHRRTQETEPLQKSVGSVLPYHALDTSDVKVQQAPQRPLVDIAPQPSSAAAVSGHTAAAPVVELLEGAAEPQLLLASSSGLLCLAGEQVTLLGGGSVWGTPLQLVSAPPPPPLKLPIAPLVRDGAAALQRKSRKRGRKPMAASVLSEESVCPPEKALKLTHPVERTYSRRLAEKRVASSRKVSESAATDEGPVRSADASHSSPTSGKPPKSEKTACEPGTVTTAPPSTNLQPAPILSLDSSSAGVGSRARIVTQAATSSSPASSSEVLLPSSSSASLPTPHATHPLPSHGATRPIEKCLNSGLWVPSGGTNGEGDPNVPDSDSADRRLSAVGTETRREGGGDIRDSERTGSVPVSCNDISNKTGDECRNLDNQGDKRRVKESNIRVRVKRLAVEPPSQWSVRSSEEAKGSDGKFDVSAPLSKRKNRIKKRVKPALGQKTPTVGFNGTADQPRTSTHHGPAPEGDSTQASSNTCSSPPALIETPALAPTATSLTSVPPRVSSQDTLRSIDPSVLAVVSVSSTPSSGGPSVPPTDPVERSQISPPAAAAPASRPPVQRRSWTTEPGGWSGGRGKQMAARVLTKLTPEVAPLTLAMFRRALDARSARDRAADRFRCCTCGKVFPAKSNLRSHMVSHTGERPFHCSACSETFSYYSNANSHLRRHSVARCSCDVCGRTFVMPMDLRRHRRTHTAGEMLQCADCPRQFSRRDNLRRHRRDCHSDGPRPAFPCQSCGKSFTSAAWLQQHRKIHTEVRDAVCRLCGAEFALRSYLERHMKSHGQQRVFCTICPRRFINVKNLLVHRETFHGNPLPLSPEELEAAQKPRPYVPVGPGRRRGCNGVTDRQLSVQIVRSRRKDADEEAPGRRKDRDEDGQGRRRRRVSVRRRQRRQSEEREEGESGSSAECEDDDTEWRPTA